MHKVTPNGADSQAALAALAEQTRALVDLTDDLARQLRAIERAQTPAGAGGLDLRATKITPDQLLDAWRAARGPKAEAHLLTRIYRRRAAGRAAL